MTIEAKLDALTAAVIGLTAAIQGSAKIGVSPSIDAAAPKEPMKAPKAAAAKTPEPAKDAAKALTYDDVKTPFLDLVRKNRDLALATLKPFGLDSLKPAKPEQFAAILAALNAAAATLIA